MHHLVAKRDAGDRRRHFGDGDIPELPRFGVLQRIGPPGLTFRVVGHGLIHHNRLTARP